MVAARQSDAAAGRRPLLPVYVVAVFLSAALLFSVQPIFAKMVLPRLGGSASVWSVALVFFQTVLLAGYAYAHLLTRHAPARLAPLIHVAVMLSATLALPLAVSAGWGRPPAQNEALWLIGLFAASIGLPFFALSANGPLLQAWFARSNHPGAEDPYFLYAASNAGSFVALLSYPFVIEPFTRLGQQTRAWSFGFYGLIGVVGACGLLATRAGTATGDGAPAADDGARPTWGDAASWAALAAIPSALLIAVTAHLSTDVAPSPFLWVVPLALYLATFVIVFQKQPVVPHRYALMVQPLLLVALTATIVYSVIDYLPVVLLLHAVAFFITALVCHGELARRRPPAGHLTAFYMWMSAGGVIGGIFSGLIAPRAFVSVGEYPLLIVLATLCRPGLSFADRKRALPIALAFSVAAGLSVVPAIAFDYALDDDVFEWGIGALLGLALFASLWRNPLGFASVVAVVFLLFRYNEPDLSRRDSVRSFFGVHKIIETDEGTFRALMHGTTIHGAERISDIKAAASVKPLPLTYYHAHSALVQTIAAARARTGGPIRIAVVGLGTGSLSCYFEPGDDWTFYEIDPAILRIARDNNRFTFLTACAPDIPVVLGDARLGLGDAPDASFDLILVDAFSSDTIPLHLLTKEAMGSYLRKLKPHGVVVLHVTNRYLELVSVAAGIAQANGLVARRNPNEAEDDDAYIFGSTVVACARTDEDFTTLVSSDGWLAAAPNPGQPVWTDDYSNIIGAMIRHMRQ